MFHYHDTPPCAALAFHYQLTLTSWASVASPYPFFRFLCFALRQNCTCTWRLCITTKCWVMLFDHDHDEDADENGRTTHMRRFHSVFWQKKKAAGLSPMSETFAPCWAGQDSGGCFPVSSWLLLVLRIDNKPREGERESEWERERARPWEQESAKVCALPLSISLSHSCFLSFSPALSRFLIQLRLQNNELCTCDEPTRTTKDAIVALCCHCRCSSWYCCPSSCSCSCCCFVPLPAYLIIVHSVNVSEHRRILRPPLGQPTPPKTAISVKSL